MKKLPASWTKSKNKQLSFTEELFAKPKEDDIFIEHFIEALKNMKFLRYRADYAKIKTIERLKVNSLLSNALEAGVGVLTKLSPKSTRYRHKTMEEYMTEIFIERITWAPAEALTMSELRQHHDNVTAKINGMILAYKHILKKHSRLTNIIVDSLRESHITLYRLENAI